jgi:hypothetical protein
MKKYLMTGMAALAICAAFTSCSKDTDVYNQNIEDQKKQDALEKNMEKVNEQYAAAFVNAFGQVGSNVDWGFGSAKANTRVLGDYDSYKGSLEPVNVSFPEDADASNFNPDLTNVLSYDDYCKTLGNANWTPDEFAYGVVYIDKVQKIHIWGEYGKRAKLYIKAGEYDFTNETFDLCADADLYLLDGAIVTLNNTAANTAKFDVYIAPGAKLIANGENGYRADVDAHVFNHGTIECTRFEVNGTSFLYNVGTLNVPEGDVYIANSTSRIVNDGTINAASTHVEGSGALQNNAEWTVTGNTVVNCNVGGWVNNGHWTTQNYHYTAGSNNVINNCFLKVTNEFNINMSSASAENGFKIDSNGGVETKTFNGGKAGDDPNSKSGPYKVIMGHKSLFKVTGTATLEGGNKGWGFFGPADGDYAVFQAKDVKRAAGLENTQGAVTYGGSLYVSAETHFAQGHDGQDADGHYFISEVGGFSVNTNIYAAGFKTGKPTITIEETPCNPGFNGDDDKPTYRVIAEDLNATEKSDFDFNDVVFDVEPNEAGTAAKIVVRAAGGIYKLTVAGYEVHAAFGENVKDDGLYPMINTKPWDPEVKATLIESYSGDFSSDAAIRNTIKNIVIKVYKPGFEENGIELSAQTGKPACKILVDQTFEVVTERTGIADKNTNFHKYVQGTWDTETNGFWWKKN